MKELKPSSKAHKLMTAFVQKHGVTHCDLTENGIRYFSIAPNRFGPGYMYLFVDGMRWSADFMKDGVRLNTPKLATWNEEMQTWTYGNLTKIDFPA